MHVQRLADMKKEEQARTLEVRLKRRQKAEERAQREFLAKADALAAAAAGRSQCLRRSGHIGLRIQLEF